MQARGKADWRAGWLAIIDAGYQLVGQLLVLGWYPFWGSAKGPLSVGSLCLGASAWLSGSDPCEDQPVGQKQLQPAAAARDCEKAAPLASGVLKQTNHIGSGQCCRPAPGWLF